MKRKAVLTVLLLVATMVLLLGYPAAGLAATWKSSNSVNVPSGTTIHDDLYVGSGNATIDGDIDGNLFIGGGNITVNGHVSKSLFVAGGTVNLNGDAGDNIIVSGGTITINGGAGGNVMVGGGQITISCLVDNDVLIGGGTVDITKKTVIGRDLLIGAGTVTMAGDVTRNVRAGATGLTITGAVDGTVLFEGETLQLGKTSTIGGDLNYYSAKRRRSIPARQLMARPHTTMSRRNKPRTPRKAACRCSAACWRPCFGSLSSSLAGWSSDSFSSSWRRGRRPSRPIPYGRNHGRV
jgi:hypothetical protein